MARGRTEALVGWRGWSWDHNQRLLRSVVWGTPWPKFEPLGAYATAWTESCIAASREEAAPLMEGAWGIHAWKKREHMDRLVKMTDQMASVWGQVSLWGTVVEHEDGWRAQFAYPLSILVLRQDRALCTDISNAYGVEASTV